MSVLKSQITTWKEDLLMPQQGDVLLNLKEGKNAIILNDFQEDKIFTLEDSSLARKLYRENQNSIKETGSAIFGIAQGMLSFEIKDKSYSLPFLLASARFQKNRFTAKYSLEILEDFTVNPVLLTLLGLENLPEKLSEAQEVITELGLVSQAQEGVWAANFHPHRFALQKEFDELLALPKYNATLRSFFGVDSEVNKLDLSDYYLFPADVSQRQAIQAVSEENIVIQGPPGTGKSQVIANLIGKVLGKGKNALLVTEKRVALEVIYDLLRQKGLHHYAALYHHDLKAKHFIRSLENTWKHVENNSFQVNQLLGQTKLLTQGLDLTLTRLGQKDLIGGVSFTYFMDNYGKEFASESYHDKKPSIPEWEKDKKTLFELEKSGFPVFGAWLNIKSDKIELKEVISSLSKVKNLLIEHKFTEITPKEIENQLKLSLLVNLFFHNDLPLPIDVFKTRTKLHKSYVELFQQLKTLSEKEAILQEEEKHWNKSFSLSELEEYIHALSSTNPFNIRSRVTRNKLAKFTDLNLSDGKKALENLAELTKTRKEIVDVKSQLRALNLSDELPVLEHIHFVTQRLKSADANEVKELFALKEEERVTLKNNSRVLEELNHYLTNFFHFDAKNSLFEQISVINDEKTAILGNSKLLEQVHPNTKLVLAQNESIEKAEQAIAYSHFIDFKGRYPNLATVNAQEITEKVEDIIQTFDKESEVFANSIEIQIREKFDAYHDLLATPAYRLTEEEKVFKQELRKGKSILVKAFSMKRVFPSVRELLESEARHWIELLQPVFLGSPYSIAKSVPIDYIFELGVFDEASQLPISHLIGSLQRCKRAVISGDEQQMAPQFYFQKKSAQQVDALHHASYYWQNKMLNYHYRSQHPALIAYSNRYFYKEELTTFPSVEADAYPIEVIEADGVYEDRINEKEAEIAANLIIKKIENHEFDFGLVAFSQAQLEAIIKKIPTSLLNQLEGKEELFIQSLENVQGDQCKHLIISLGYGKNTDGEFHKRFGPLNQEQGHRRLNVLMSRAISKITFIRSVTSTDFSISDNEGVEHLRKLMLFLEEDVQISDTKSTFYQLKEGKEVEIPAMGTLFPETQTLIDHYRVLQDRKWKIKLG